MDYVVRGDLAFILFSNTHLPDRNLSRWTYYLELRLRFMMLLEGCNRKEI